MVVPTRTEDAAAANRGARSPASPAGSGQAASRLAPSQPAANARIISEHRGRIGELAAAGFAESAHRAEARATGPAGTVYLCHPFLVHTAQPHRGAAPRFIAQPPLLPAVPLDPWRADAAPVERAIRRALEPR